MLSAIALWGIFALRLARPIVLIKLAANVAAVIFTIASIHLLYLNTRLLPRELHPPLWRRIALVGMAGFYGTFAALSLRTLW